MRDRRELDHRLRCVRLASVALTAGVLALAACQSVPDAPSATTTASRVLPALAAEEGLRYAIVSDLSDVRFLVFRAGPLARLGHHHVVRATTIRGEVRLAQELRQSTFSIAMPVKDFRVDDPQDRRDEGGEFLPQPDSEAVAGTTLNMLGEKVLDAARYPNIEITSLSLNGPAWGLDIAMKIGLHGVERELVVPAAVQKSDGQLVVTAFFSLKQTDFGIVPLSVLGGSLQVDNTVRVRMRIVARPAGSSSR